MRRELGRHIVIDPEIHHGDITFRGTRVLVADVLNDVARGRDWDAIIEDWHGPPISREAIAEAVLLAREALLVQHGQGERSESASG